MEMNVCIKNNLKTNIKFIRFHSEGFDIHKKNLKSSKTWNFKVDIDEIKVREQAFYFTIVTEKNDTIKSECCFFTKSWGGIYEKNVEISIQENEVKVFYKK